MSDPREEVLALIAARPQVQPNRGPALVSPHPLRPVSAQVAALMAAREQRGLSASGSEYPRREKWQVLIVPAAVIGTLAALVAIVAAAISHPGAALLAAAVWLAAMVVAAIGGWWVLADPLRVGRRLRLELLDAGHWESRQDWTGEAKSGPERALMNVTVSAATGHSRSADNLAAELDGIDAEARPIATVRLSNPQDPDLKPAWDALIDRVIALGGSPGDRGVSTTVKLEK
jgi:hypothetical protein